MTTFYSLYIPRAIKEINLLKHQTYRDITSIDVKGRVYKYITPWIYHLIPQKTFNEWVWSKWVRCISSLPYQYTPWKNDIDIIYSYWFGNIMKSERITDWISHSKEHSPDTELIKYMCNNGLAAHMVIWENDSYMVDLRSMSLSVKDGLFPYGCLLVLNAGLEPKYIRMDYTPAFYEGKIISYEKKEFTSYKDDEAWNFACQVFLSSLIVKTTLIDKTLCSRFIYSGNIISSIFKYKDKLPQDLIDFVTPFNTIKGNQRVFEEFMNPGGLYDRVFGFENVTTYVSHEAEFWYWESPKDLFYKNINKELPRGRKMPSDEPEKLSDCTSCRTNRKFPRWYWDAMKYWDEVEKFCGEWVDIFYKNCNFEDVEKWMEFYENKKQGKDIHISPKERLIRILTSLIWNVSFFYTHVNIGKWAFYPGLVNSKIYLGESSRYDNIGMAVISILSEAEYKPQIIGSLWLTQDEKYKEIWMEFERRVERLEFKALDLIGGELECCV